MAEITDEMVDESARVIARLVPCSDGGRWTPDHGHDFPREYSVTEVRLIRTIARACLMAQTPQESEVPNG